MSIFSSTPTTPMMRPRGGFSLIEVIMSTTIFIVSMLIIVGSLLSLNAATRKAESERLASDNISAAIDSMSRNIRMGTKFHCGCGSSVIDGGPVTQGDDVFPNASIIPRECPLSGTGDVCLAFEAQGGDPTVSTDQVVYRLRAGRIERSKNGGQSGGYITITSPQVYIKDLHFYVSGVESPPVQQPFITMVIRGLATTSPKNVTNFNVETSISARIPNY